MFDHRPPWSWLDVILVYLGIIVLSTLWGIYGQQVMLYLYRWGAPDTGLTYFAASYLFQFSVTVGLVLLLSGTFHRAGWQEIGLTALSADKFFRYGIIGGLILMVVILLLTLPIEITKPDLPPQIYEQMLCAARGIRPFLLLLFMGTILAPLAEELFYRGMIYPLARHSLGPVGGAIGAGLIFGLAHWDLWRAIPLTVGGIILCYIYEKSGSIWASIAAHGIWNGLMALLVYFSLSYYP